MRLAELLPFSFARDPRSRLRRGVIATAALALSLGLHTGLPFLRFPTAAPATSRIAMEILQPPPLMPLPVEDEPRDGPADDPGAPPAEIDDDAPDAVALPDSAEQPPDEAPPDEAPPDEPPPEEAPPEEDAPDDAPSEQAVAQQADAPLERTARARLRANDDISERISRRRAHLEAARRAAAERRKAREAARGRGGGAAPIGSAKLGDPEAVHLCDATSLGRALRVDAERPLTAWVAVVPTALVGFETRPSLGRFLDDLSQVLKRERRGVKRLGHVEFALPPDVLQFQLDAPSGVRVALGRGDGRCLVGLKYTAQLFPITLTRVPLRIIDRSNNTADALVDIRFFKDASFELVARDDAALPFTRGKIANSRVIATNIEDHYQAARLAKAVAGFFGVDLRKAVRERQRAEAAQRTTIRDGRARASVRGR